MQKLFAHPRRFVKSSRDEQEWAEGLHELIAGYFEGHRSDQDLREGLRGYRSFRLMTMTDPGTEKWSLLMSALDVIVGLQSGPPDVKISHGFVSWDEWTLSLATPVKKERHAW